MPASSNAYLRVLIEGDLESCLSETCVYSNLHTYTHNGHWERSSYQVDPWVRDREHVSSNVNPLLQLGASHRPQAHPMFQKEPPQGDGHPAPSCFLHTHLFVARLHTSRLPTTLPTSAMPSLYSPTSFLRDLSLCMWACDIQLSRWTKQATLNPSRTSESGHTFGRVHIHIARSVSVSQQIHCIQGSMHIREQEGRTSWVPSLTLAQWDFGKREQEDFFCQRRPTI